MAFKMKKPVFFNVGNKYEEQNPSAVFQQKKENKDGSVDLGNRTEKKETNEEKLARMDAEYQAGLKERLSLTNPEHDANNAEEYDMALERLMNDHDVNDKGVAETGAAAYKTKLAKLEAKAKKEGW